jgi:nucleotide-binding universal stress UspA family protein
MAAGNRHGRLLKECLSSTKLKVTVVLVTDKRPAENRALLGTELINHLRHHGIGAALHRTESRNGDVAAALISEAKRRKADLIIMGGYGHSRLREQLLGGVTDNLLYQSPVPVLMAH